MGLIRIHDDNGNGKNGYHGDQLECSYCDGNGTEKYLKKTYRCRHSVKEPNIIYLQTSSHPYVVGGYMTVFKQQI